MSPTSRNTLLIGGALIVIALLFTCGPMKSWFGAGEAQVKSTPDVAAGPPAGNVNAAGSLAGATAGAMAGAQVGTSDLSALEAGDDVDGAGRTGERDDLAAAGFAAAAATTAGATSGAASSVGAASVVAGVAAVGAATGGIAAAGKAGSGGASAARSGAASAARKAALPSVSAGPPDVPVANVSAPDPAALAAAAAATAVDAFDDTFSGGSGEGDLMAGRVVDRFAPPVAAVGGSPLVLTAQQKRFGAAGARNACDSPGAGCQNVRSLPPNPPIVGGVRPRRTTVP